MPQLMHLKLEEQRNALIRAIEVHQPQGSLRNRVTVIFDGQKDIYGGKVETTQVEVIFARDETADAKIKELVAQSLQKKNMCVVTDDRDLQISVGHLGAQCVAVQSFLSKCREQVSSSKKQPYSAPNDNGKNISKTDEHKITSELSRIWLEKDKKR